MTIQERIIQYIGSKGITPYRFCKDLGFSMGYLDKRGAIGTDRYLKIIKHYPDINPQWLLTGKGTMLKDEKEHAPSPNEDLLCVNEETAIYNKVQTCKDTVEENHLLEEENKIFMQDKMETSNIKERILDLAENVEVSKQEFFRKIKITYGNFTGDKKNRPVNSHAIKNILLMYPQTNPYWLLTGKGAMLKDQKESIYNQNEDPLYVNEDNARYNKTQSSKDLAEENNLLKEENKALMQDKITIMQDKMTIMQDNSTLKDNTLLLMNEKIELKEENISLKYKVKELEAQNNSLTEEVTLLKKAQQSGSSTIHGKKHELVTEKQ